jgi:N-acetylneuraminic acid mutarotase
MAPVRLRFLSLVAVALSGFAVAPAASSGSPTAADDLRVIEAVRWSHRMWPSANAGAKPALDQILPADTFVARADDNARRITALRTYWGRTLSEREVQAELDRMARDSRAPEALREMFAALGNDPDRIAQALVLPAMTDRLIRRLYAYDASLQGATRHRAEKAVRRFQDPADMQRLASESKGEYSETSYFERRGDDAGALAAEDTTPGAVRLGADAWARLIDQLPAAGQIGRIEESDDELRVTAVLERTSGHVRSASVQWRKTPFEDWWQSVKGDIAPAETPRASHFVLPQSPGTGCTEGTWSPIHPPMPDARDGHTAVWTGSEMLVWGGNSGEGVSGTGLRYDPTTDSWTPMPDSGAPSARNNHKAIWTGTEMIVWGGIGGTGAYQATGGRFNPATGTWTPTRVNGTQPEARIFHTLVWTGSDVIVWGGHNNLGTLLSTGGRYNPASDTWTPTSTVNAAMARAAHSAIWTGSEMVVYGGYWTDASTLANGGRYFPATDSWIPISISATTRRDHAAFWTGTDMLVWGGYSVQNFPQLNTITKLNSGFRYNPVTGTTVSTKLDATTPAARFNFAAAFTGNRLIVWGGEGMTGGVYSLATDTWTPTRLDSTTPGGRNFHTAVWTGTEMIVFGGGLASNDPASLLLSSGGRYNPATDNWTPTSIDGTPLPRSGPFPAQGIWTGNEMIVYGNSAHALYEPATDSWHTMPTDSVYGNFYPTLVWTGREAFAFGMVGSLSYAEMIRFDPTLNIVREYYLPSVANAPSVRQYQTTVWTGSELIVWGGGPGPLNTGAHYSPATDTWVPTRQDATTPAPRMWHTAVWSGSEMIVSGGKGSSGWATDGGRYDPATDSWTPLPAGALPRVFHTAVWTGTQMIVWGGDDSSGNGLKTGDRFDPVTSTWSPVLADATAPSPRFDQTAVWTGENMIVWGGAADNVELGDGGLYDPALDSWTAIPAGGGSPSERSDAIGAWTGTDMIIWGGGKQTGALYCGCPAGNYYLDADGDGHGDRLRMSCGPAAGYVASADDCNDGSAASWSAPGEARDLMFTDQTTLVWSPPADTGGTTSLLYDLVRAPYPSAGSSAYVCAGSDLAVLTTTDAAIPPSNNAFYYQVRAQNACPGGIGPLGLHLHDGAPAEARSCP